MTEQPEKLHPNVIATLLRNPDSIPLRNYNAPMVDARALGFKHAEAYCILTYVYAERIIFVWNSRDGAPLETIKIDDCEYWLQSLIAAGTFKFARHYTPVAGDYILQTLDTYKADWVRKERSKQKKGIISSVSLHTPSHDVVGETILFQVTSTSFYAKPIV